MKRYVLVGAGSRARYMFAKPMAHEWKGRLLFSGLYDVNPLRARYLSEECGGVPVYGDFREMLASARPDVVVVASPDDTHHEYLIEALRAGCDVISEKPLTIDEDKCRAILEAERESGRRVAVAFNLRYAPYFAAVKELLLGGAIGRIGHVDLEWHLDRRHGADYFRRWHARMSRSGGLLVHKSTHHFDLVNWWLDSRPAEVHAYGSRAMYGDDRPERGERCLSCRHASSCEFYLDIGADPFLSKYYLGAEGEDGYVRDRCVFDPEIDIYDNMSVHVRYESGALLTYSLTAYSPYEGWRASLNGSEGRMELGETYSGSEMSAVAGGLIRICRPDGSVETIRVDAPEGGHGGGDERLRQALFEGVEVDALGRRADSVAGALSLLVGATANRSIAERRALPIPEVAALAGAAPVTERPRLP